MANVDVMSLSARLTLDTSQYEAALHNAVNAGSNVTSNLSQVSTGMNTAQSSTNELASQMQKASMIGNLMASAIKSATSAIVDFGKQSIGAGMSFDSSMSQVAATMGVTVDEVQELRDFAQDMGASTAFSATQAADALNYMALAGYDAEKSMSMLPNVLNLAASGGMDLATASDMITDAQSALGLSMDETTELVNKMAKTASSSNTSVSQLGEAMLQIGGSAKKLKGGTTELTTILGMLADNGMKGAEGGTHLRNMLTSLMSPTKDATAMMEKLGVSLYDSEGNMRSLNDVFIDLRNGMDSLATQAERDQVITSIFNARDMKAAEAMIANVGDRYEELSGKIDEAAGAAQDMANTQLDNLQGDITLFKSAVEGAQIAVSDRLTPSLRKFTQFGSKAVSEMSKGFGRDGLSGAMEALHLTIGKEFGDTAKAIFAVESATKGAIAAFITYKALVKGWAAVQAIMATVKAIQAATTAQEAFNAVTALNPYAAILAGVAAASVALRSYINAQTDAIDVTVDGDNAMTDAQKELLASIEETNKAVNEGVQASKDRMQQTEDDADATENLYKQLWRLKDIEELSSSQKAKMAAIVEELNGKVAGLNLQFDEQTGKLKNNKEAVDELMNSYLKQAKVEAARENLVELMKQQMTAEDNLTKATSERNKLIYRRNELEQTRERLERKLANTENLTLDQQDDIRYSLKEVNEELSKVKNTLGGADGVNNAFTTASATAREVNEQVDKMCGIIGQSKEEFTAQQQAVDKSTGSLATYVAGIAQSVISSTSLVENAASTYYDTVNEIAGVTMSINHRVVDLSGETAESIGSLLDQYDSLVEKQKSAIEGSVSFFGGFDTEESTTFETLWKNLSDTNYALETWATNIENLESRNVSGALIQQLKDMGLGSWAEVNAMVNSTDEELKRYSELWDKTEASVASVTDRMVKGQKKSIENQLRELAGVPTGHIEDFKQAYYDMGIAADTGFEKGVHDKLAEAAKSGKDLAEEAIDETTTELDAHSPSKEFERLGRYAAQGFAIGLRDEAQLMAIEAASQNIARTAIDAVTSMLGIHSPSKVLRKMGGFFSEGFALGINDNAGMAEESAMMMADSAAESAYIEPSVGSITANTQAADSQLGRQATINLSVDGQLMASVLAPLIDVISGRNIMLATRGRQL